jgi:hypothetical protein
LSRFRFSLQGLSAAGESPLSLALQAFLLAGFLMIPFSARAIAGFGNERESARGPHWRVDLNGLPAGWSARAFSATPSQAAMLRYTDWAGFHVRTPDGLWADVIHLFWGTGHGMPSIAFYHTPALCLPATGWQIIGEPEPIVLDGHGEKVNFVRYLVQQEDERMMALQFVSRGTHIDPFLVAAGAGKGRLERFAELWRGSRDPVNEEILLYLSEPGSGNVDTVFASEVFSKVFKPADL